MKKTLYTIIAISALVLSAVSCSLEEKKQGFVSTDDFFKTSEQCYASLNSCYIPLKSIYTYTFFIATECVTDLAYIASGTQDAQLDVSPAKPRFGNTVWKQCYTGIRNSNAAIYGIEGAEFDEKDKIELLGEGKILRAYYYYLLTCFFGDVPFYLEDVNTVEKLQEVAKLPRMSADSTRATLIEELLEIVPQMKQVRSCDVAKNRVGAAMGWMVIAKMAMWNEEWDIAIDACNHLEEMYGDLEQYPLEDILFRNKNTPESIFEIQHTYTAGGLQYTSNLACICTPTHKGTTYIYDGVEVPELGNQATTWTAMRPNAYYHTGLMPRSAVDLRKDINLAWEYNGQVFANVSGRPWPGPKFWCPDMAAERDGNNYKVFRYADVLLMLAECYCEKQDEVKSMDYLNRVKTRAGIKLYTTFKTYPRLMEEIRKERGRELFGEFQRKFDLVRWGTWYEDTYAYTDYTTLKDNIQPYHRYYPIPDTEVVYSGYALDNKEYEQNIE